MLLAAYCHFLLWHTPAYYAKHLWRGQQVWQIIGHENTFQLAILDRRFILVTLELLQYKFWTVSPRSGTDFKLMEPTRNGEGNAVKQEAAPTQRLLYSQPAENKTVAKLSSGTAES